LFGGEVLISCTE